MAGPSRPLEPAQRRAIGFDQNSSDRIWRHTRWGGCVDCLDSREAREGGAAADKPLLQPSEPTAEDELIK